MMSAAPIICWGRNDWQLMKQMVWNASDLKCFTGICQKGLKKTTKNHNQDSWTFASKIQTRHFQNRSQKKHYCWNPLYQSFTLSQIEKCNLCVVSYCKVPLQRWVHSWKLLSVLIVQKECRMNICCKRSLEWELSDNQKDLYVSATQQLYIRMLKHHDTFGDEHCLAKNHTLLWRETVLPAAVATLPCVCTSVMLTRRCCSPSMIPASK